jgi:hypothetical protein
MLNGELQIFRFWLGEELVPQRGLPFSQQFQQFAELIGPALCGHKLLDEFVFFV